MQDQRHDWWKRYGEASGKGYAGLPEELQQETFAEITAQPLLNYLVALSYERRKIQFTDDTTLNQIYADLVSAVYNRQYAGECGKGRVSACVGTLEEKDFVRVLEEIALAVWHGDGRTATVASIQEKCKAGKIERYLQAFTDGVKVNEGVTRLLTAFYFRQSESRRDGDHTFEFTHKSFGEYLTALRIVRLLKKMRSEHERRQHDPDEGWDEKEALLHWTKLCAVTAMDDDLLRFIANEFRTMSKEALEALQAVLCGLLSYTINQGLPIPEEFTGGKFGFKEHLRLARNAEEALLAVHCSVAQITEQVSELTLASDIAFGEWIARLRGQRQGPENTLALRSLGFLDLSGSSLDIQDFYGATLNGATLIRADLRGADLSFADLSGAKLSRAKLSGAKLRGADLRGADLSGAKLEGAKLEGAEIKGANFQGTILEDESARRNAVKGVRIKSNDKG